jgi:hypothetical protein
VLELTHVGVFNAPVNFDFTHQLLLGTTLCETQFLDNFSRVDVFSLGINELPALGKSAFAQKLAFYVASGGVVIPDFVFLLDVSILRSHLSRSFWG